MIGYGPSGSYCLQKDLIIEQLGRMLVQDGYDEETVIEAATLRKSKPLPTIWQSEGLESINIASSNFDRMTGIAVASK